MNSKLKMLLSYLIPVTLRKYPSERSGEVEINLIDGKKVLDTKTTNYSFGSLQKVLARGLQEIAFDSSFQKILLLGLGGGSVIQTIRKEFDSHAMIDAVEIDEKIIDIAINEFDIHQYAPLVIHHTDAFEFVKHSVEVYDLIIVDIFIENKVPKIFLTREFIKYLSERLMSEGKLIFNLMPEAYTPLQWDSFRHHFGELGFEVREIKNLLKHNYLLIGHKQNNPHF